MSPSPFHGIFSSGSDDIPSHREVPHAHHGRVRGITAPIAGVDPAITSAKDASARAGAGGQVALDIFEYENYYIIKAPMAGVKLSDVDIEISDNVITIRGIRRQTDAIPAEQYFLRECFWGDFSRSVTLPFSIDPRKVKATFNKDCILKVLVPKEERVVKIVRIND